MASIISRQFMGRSVSASTWAAASRAESSLAVFGAALLAVSLAGAFFAAGRLSGSCAGCFGAGCLDCQNAVVREQKPRPPGRRQPSFSVVGENGLTDHGRAKPTRLATKPTQTTHSPGPIRTETDNP